MIHAIDGVRPSQRWGQSRQQDLRLAFRCQGRKAAAAGREFHRVTMVNTWHAGILSLRNRAMRALRRGYHRERSLRTLLSLYL